MRRRSSPARLAFPFVIMLAQASVAMAGGQARTHHGFEVFVDAGAGTPIYGVGLLGGTSSSDLRESWRGGAALSGGVGFAIGGSRMLMFSVQYGEYEFDESRFSKSKNYNGYVDYTSIQGGGATSLAALIGLRLHKDLANAWPYVEFGAGYGRIALPVVTAETGAGADTFYGRDHSGLAALVELGAEFLRQSRVGGVVSLGLHFLPDQSLVTSALVGLVYHA